MGRLPLVMLLLSVLPIVDGMRQTYTYDEVGNRSTVTYANGTNAEYDYDDLNRLTLLVNSKGDGSGISSYRYELASAGNRTKVVESDPNDGGPGPKRTVEYKYDDLYRLTEETEWNAEHAINCGLRGHW